MMAGLTWTCHVCHRERPDELIGVSVRDLSSEKGLPPGTWKESVRFCIDDDHCIAAAETYTHSGAEVLTVSAEDEAASYARPGVIARLRGWLRL